MTTRPRSSRHIVLSVLLACGAGHAQHLGRGTLDSGGGFSSGGSYAVHGTLGQPDVGLSVGAGYQLRGGFWTDLSATDALFADGFE